jgi:hypothetical protein
VFYIVGDEGIIVLDTKGGDENVGNFGVSFGFSFLYIYLD